MRQIVGFLPKVEKNEDYDSDASEQGPNLEIMKRGISSFVKLNVLPRANGPDKIKGDPRLGNIIT